MSLTEIRCAECRAPFEVDSRRPREGHVCRDCKRADPGPPAEEHYAFWRCLPPEEFDRVVRAMASLQP